MELASTSRAQLSYLLESAFGAIPGAGTPKKLRMTGESLDFAISNETSKELRDDRQVTDLVQVGASASGGFNFELSYNEFDPLIEAALMDTWDVYGTNGVGSVFSADFTATTITAGVAPTGANAFTNLALGQWFKLDAPTHANDGQYFRVSSSVSPTTTVITVDAATPLAVGTGVANTKISTSRLVNGTTQRSFVLEKSFGDVSQFFAYRGMTASKMSLSFQSGAILTGSFDFMGKDALRADLTNMPGAASASLAYDVMNSVRGVGQIMEGGALLTGTFIKSLSLDIDNKLRGRDAIGTLGNVSIGAGTLEVKGTMEVYLADGDLYDKFLNNVASSLSLRATDGDGNGYFVSLPNVKYNDAKVQAGGMDQDAMLSIPFTALLDTVSGKTIAIDRVGVAVV
jgi:hypothetical protein